MRPRFVQTRLEHALDDTPVVFLTGPRQAGKTTLVRSLVQSGVMESYLTLDDATVRRAASSDPEAFLAGLGSSRTVIDEVQRAPSLFLPLKAAVDRDRRPGRLLLTGSADVANWSELASALVGRIEPIPLWPLSEGELEAARSSFLAKLFSETKTRAWKTEPETREQTLSRVERGGYPEVTERASASRRSVWFASYLQTLVERDIQDIARVDAAVELTRLLALMAARSSAILNFADLARDAGFPQTTLKRYVALLEAVYLIRIVPAWFINVSKRLVKSPKLLFVDSGVACHLVGASPLRSDNLLAGHLLEGLVGAELLKQIGWAEQRFSLHHFRAHTGQEVDWVVEAGNQTIAGVEVKLSSSVSAGDFAGLRLLREIAPKRFKQGVVLYLGQNVVPFGPDLFALPISALWRA